AEQGIKKKESTRDQLSLRLAHEERYRKAIEHYLGHAVNDLDRDTDPSFDETPAPDLQRAELLLAGQLRDAAAGDPGAAKSLPAPVDPKLVAASDDVSAAKEEHGLLREGLEGQHPMLAAFRDDIGSLTGSDDDVAQRIAIKAIETLANIKKVRKG